MTFKTMPEMKNSEVELLLHLFYPFGKVQKIWRNKKCNSLRVFFSLPDDSDTILHEINLLPDDVYLIPDNAPNDERLVENCENLYRYRQFTIARGYSEMWLDNPYILV